jgi:arylsulfatase A-like enzyme
MFPHYLRQAGYHTTNCSKQDYNFTRDDTVGVWDQSSGKASYKNRKPGQPFFHVQNYGATHEGSLHFPAEAMEQPTLTNPETVSLFPYHPDTRTFRYTHARYLDSHMQVDTQMGSFVQGLEDEGLLDDTFIFYYGDHGGVLPRGKGYIYESGLHVPMVVYVPRNWKHLAPAAPGSRVDGFVQFIDLSATVLNLAGVDIPDGIDGHPFLGKGVSLDELNAHDTAFGYADRFDEKYDLVRTFRKGRFKYMRNYQPFNFDGLQNNYRYQMLAYQEWRDLYHSGKLNAEQRQFFEPRPAECLYDLASDPHEVHNLAGDPAHAEVLADLRRRLQQQVRSMPDLSFIPEPVFLKAGGDDPVGFGQAKQREIARLLQVADLSLQPFPDIQDQLARALHAKNPWERYWGLIVCSSFREQASPFYEKAATMSAADDERLVRVRAAEFLGLVGVADPRPVLTQALQQTTDPVEANLILNSVTLLSDSPPGYVFTLPPEILAAAWAKGKNNQAGRRIEYLRDK